MIMTSDAIRHDIARIDALIAALSNSYPIAEEDHDDLCWLARERDHLRRLLLVRRVECRKSIVSLELWRTGDLPTDAVASRAA